MKQPWIPVSVKERKIVRVIRTRDDALIVDHIDMNPQGRGLAEARLTDFGTPVWALIAYLDARKGDLAAVAEDYELPIEAVEAAIAFYKRHKPLIDARLLVNAAA